MGTKIRYIVLIIFFSHALLDAQVTLDYRYVDSLTYRYYMSGEWNNLITLGNQAIDNNIDYKYLRQRIGYALFALGNYSDAKYQFEKALSFDRYNALSLEYLYYSYLNTGKDDYAGIFARRMSHDLQKSLSITPFKPLESIEFEYNFKFAGTYHRSNPRYYRIGITSKLGYRFTLYQAFSNFDQEIYIQQPVDYNTILTSQPEYYSLLKYAISSHLQVKTAYHYLNTTTDTSVKNGHFVLLALSQDINRLSIEANGSVLTFGKDPIYQTGVQTGYCFPGRSGFCLTSTFSWLLQQNSSSFIYNQKAGFKVTKKAWMEANITFGRMDNYNDYNGLYVYNSYDPMTFRSGASMFYYLTKNITLWANYTYERKDYYESSSNQYNQFSYLGGIKWKL